MQSTTAALWIVATPIGNLGDFSDRARRTLVDVALIAAEDTRHSARLTRHLGIDTPMVSLHEHNEHARVERILESLAAGESVALISDAGETNGAFRSLMGFQVERARRHFESGRRLLPLLPAQSRACPSVLVGFYSAILDKIEASGFDVYRRRVRLSSAEKLLLLARLWATSLISATPLQRR